MGDIREKTRRQAVTGTKLEPPKYYNVVFLNDDLTPMNLVVEVLISIFHQAREDAITIMLEAHSGGKGRIGPYSHEVAEWKAYEGMTLAAEFGHPLTLDIEET